MNFKDLIMFGNEMLNLEIKALNRGRNEATMYFLIPKTLKNIIKTKKPMSCGIVNGEKKDKYLIIKIK